MSMDRGEMLALADEVHLFLQREQESVLVELFTRIEGALRASAAPEEGKVLVPREPTGEMCFQGERAGMAYLAEARADMTIREARPFITAEIYKAMVACAPALPPATEDGGREARALLDILDISIPDDGLLKGKMVMAIGQVGARMCWTPQNSYEHAVINLLGCKLRDLRAALSPSPSVGTGKQAVPSAQEKTP